LYLRAFDAAGNRSVPAQVAANISAKNDGRAFIPIAAAGICIVGDSFDVRSMTNTTSPTNPQISPLGIWNWTNAFLDQKLQFLNINATSGCGAIAAGSPVAGYESPAGAYMTKLPAVVATYNPATVAVRVSVNDFATSNTLADLIAAYSACFQYCWDRGIRIITNTCAPFLGYGTPPSAGQLSIWRDFNRWLMTTAPTRWPGIIVLRQHWQNALDAMARTGFEGTAVISNDVHPYAAPTFEIGWASAQQLAPYLASIASPLDKLSGIQDSINAMDRNPLNQGNAGGGTVTGTHPSGFTSSVSTGSASGAAKFRGDGNGLWYQIDWTPGAGDGNVQMAQSSIALSADFSPGKQAQLLCELEIDAASAGTVECVRAQVNYTGGVSTTVIGMAQGGSGAGAQYDPSARRGWKATFATPIHTVPDGSTNATITYYLFKSSTGTAAVSARIGRHGLVPVG
jgi:hypothetical protein